MAEEKKVPNLKERLKKTVVGPAGAGPVAPPVGVVPPVGPAVVPPTGGSIPAPPIVPGVPGVTDAAVPGAAGLPGVGGDVAPPPFVQQQQAQAAMAARVRAAAEDPFSAAVVAPAGPQEVRIVVDEKPVDDKEIGRKKTGQLIALAATGLIALGSGYAIGGMMEAKAQERQTLSAVNNVRTEFQRVGDVIAQIKQHVDRAAERGNIQVQRGEDDQPQQATHPPEVDEELINWFREQPPDPPLSPDVYAGRVGRLRSNVVGKITLVQLQFNEVWRQLAAHVRMTNVANVRAALQASNPQNNEFSRMLVTFGRNPQGAAFALLVTAAGQPSQPGGPIPIAGAGIASGQTRTLYQTGDIRSQDLTNLVIPVNPTQGLAAQAQAAATLPWLQYRQRIGDLKALVDQLATNHQQLMDALSGGGNRAH